MICPRCGSMNVRVVNSKTSSKDVVRKRKCSECGKRFYTIETMISYGAGRSAICIGERTCKNRRAERREKKSQKTLKKVLTYD